MTRSTQAPCIDLRKLPPINASKFVYSFIAHFIKHFEVRNFAACLTNIEEFRRDLQNYVRSDEFNGKVKEITSGTSPIDGFLVWKNLKVKIQEFVGRIIEEVPIADLLSDLNNVQIILDKEHLMTWGTRSQLCHKKITPGIFVGTDFVEGIRLWPSRQLATVRKGKADVVVSGFVRDMTVSKEVYAVLVIGFVASYVMRFGNVYVLLIPFDLTKEPLENYSAIIRGLRDIIGQMGRRDPSSIPDAIYTMALASLSGATKGAFEICIHEVGEQKGFHVKAEIYVRLDNLVTLVKSIDEVGRDKVVKALRLIVQNLEAESSVWSRMPVIANYLVAASQSPPQTAIPLIEKALCDLDRMRWTTNEEYEVVNTFHKLASTLLEYTKMGVPI